MIIVTIHHDDSIWSICIDPPPIYIKCDILLKKAKIRRKQKHLLAHACMVRFCCSFKLNVTFKEDEQCNGSYVLSTCYDKQTYRSDIGDYPSTIR